jgi:hypothetical protein
MSQEEPQAVVDARAIVASQSRRGGAMLLGMVIGMLLIMAVPFLGLPEPFIGMGIFVMLATTAYQGMQMARLGADFKRASNIIEEWERAGARQLFAATTGNGVDPNDPRWQQMLPLVERITELAGEDGHLAETVQEAREQLRDALLDLGSLDEALATERALGTDSGHDARLERLERAKTDAVARADSLIGSLRDVHVSLLERGADTEDLAGKLSQIVHRLTAENEVDRLPREKPGTSTPSRPRPQTDKE